MMTFTITKRHLITALFIILLCGFSFSWYLFPSFYWLLAPATGITVVSAIVLWFTNRDDEETKQRKASDKQDKLAINKLFKLLLKELKERAQFKQKYRLPWYLHLSHNLQEDGAVLNQMGFRFSKTVSLNNQLPIQVWFKNNAVIFSAGFTEQDHRTLTCLKLLLSKVKSFRSRQALNGILVSQSITDLLKNDKVSNKQRASDSRLVIDNVQKICGQKLPIYVLFNQMANLSDFCQYFSSLADEHIDGCFGAQIEKSALSKGYSLNWFNKAFDELCQRMGRSIIFALDHQLNEDFRRSIIAAPIQLRAVKNDISEYLSELLFVKKTSQEYQFRGFFFTNTDNNSEVNDPLTKQVAYQLDHHEMMIPSHIKLPHSIFVSELFNRFIRPEAGTAQVNKLRKRLLLSFQVSYVAFILLLVGSTVVLFKTNIEYYQALNSSTLKQLDRYKKDVQKTPYDKSNLGAIVGQLTKLSQTYHQYKEPDSIYLSNIIPNPSFYDALEKAYKVELANVLLPTLINHVEMELMNIQQTGTVLQTAEMANLVKSLATLNKESWGDLKDYFQQSIASSRVSEHGFKEDLVTLMDDLYGLGLPKADINRQLVASVESKLNATNHAGIVYKYLKNLQQFSSVVNVENELSKNFEQLYHVKNKALLQVPYLYTPQGFAAFTLNANSPLMKESIQANSALLGEDINSYQINNLIQQLQRLYQQEYITYWRKFIENINLQPVSYHRLNFTLDLLAVATDSPLSRLYDVIGYYTSPTLGTLTVDESQSDTESSDKPAVPLLEKTSTVIEPSSDQIKMEQSIHYAFAVYHDFISVDDKGQSKLSNVVTNYRQVKTWLDKSNQSKDIPAELYQQLIATEKDASLYQLSQTQSGISQLDEYTAKITQIINQHVREEVTDYLNNQWQKKVIDPFTTFFAQKFPFNTQSDANVSLKLFNRYFKAEGLFAGYIAELSSSLEKMDDKVFLIGFLPTEYIYINNELLKLQEHLSVIHQTLYQQNNNQLSIPFKINVQSMSAELLQFELFSQRTILNYQHGPKLWRDFVWPDLNTQDEILAIFTDTAQQKQNKRFNGEWAWLRLIYENNQSSQGKTIVTLGEDDRNVNLVIVVESDENPFEQNFFNQFKPPKSIIINE